MGSFAVSPSDLQALDGFVTAAAEHARTSVERLGAEADALFDVGWHGPAATAFRVGWQHWLDAARTVIAALDEMAGLVGASAAEYADTDETVRVSLARSSA